MCVLLSVIDDEPRSREVGKIIFRIVLEVRSKAVVDYRRVY